MSRRAELSRLENCDMKTRRLFKSVLVLAATSCALLWNGSQALAHDEHKADGASGAKARITSTESANPAATPPTSVKPPKADSAKLSPGIAEVVKLFDSGVPEDVLLAYIQNSHVGSPNAAELVYLHELGLSTRVSVALLVHGNKSVRSSTEAPATESSNGAAPSQPTLARPMYAQPAAASPVVYTQPTPVYVQSAPVYVQPTPTATYVGGCGSPAYTAP